MSSLETENDRNEDALRKLWAEVRGRLPSEDEGELGEIHVGSVARSRDEWPFAFSNDGQECVNLTLELKPDQLELNLTGWKETQSDALKDWLQTVAGEDAVNALAGYEVVAFARQAYKKTPSSKPYWLVEAVDELDRIQASQYTARWLAEQMIRLEGNRKEVKPAFHVRRTWSRTSGCLDDAMLDELATEVQRLLPILRQIWARP
jgi:hypothetical protein